MTDQETTLSPAAEYAAEREDFNEEVCEFTSDSITPETLRHIRRYFEEEGYHLFRHPRQGITCTRRHVYACYAYGTLWEASLLLAHKGYNEDAHIVECTAEQMAHLLENSKQFVRVDDEGNEDITEILNHLDMCRDFAMGVHLRLRACKFFEMNDNKEDCSYALDLLSEATCMLCRSIAGCAGCQMPNDEGDE